MRWLAICAALAGCGRLSFDTRPLVDDALVDAVAIDVPDASPAITSREAERATFSTTSTTFVDVPDATLMVPPSPGQKWWLLVNGYLTSTSEVYNGPEAQYLVDGVPRGIGGTESVESKPGPWQHFYVFDGTTEWITIQVQLRDAMGATATLSHLRVVAIPLPAASDPLYVSIDATLPVPMGTSTVATLDLGTPAASKPYMFFLLDNARESPGSGDVEVTWYEPNNPTVLWRGPDKNPRGAWQSSLYVRSATIGPGPVTIRLDAFSGDTSELSYVRVLALDLTAFVRVKSASSALFSQTTAGPTEVNSIFEAIEPAPQYVSFGTMKVDDDCSGPTIATRGIHYVLDGVEMAIQHEPGNCAIDVTYGFLDLTTTAPSYLSAQISSGTGEDVEHHESQLLILGVD